MASAGDQVAAELSPAPPLVVPTKFDQWFTPGGRNEGTEWLVDYLSKLARHGNDPLAVTAGWGRTWGSGESDHHGARADSWANDLAVPGVSTPTAAIATAAQRLGSALDEPGWTSGQLVKTYNGYRLQLLWKVAGHFDHIHNGVRKV
ncbi:MAG: hypothetical protein ACRD2W_03600 [Acidimicrobiales bacterium]